MDSTPAVVSPSLRAAVTFLTSHLPSTFCPSKLQLLQQILESALVCVPTWVRNSRLTLTLSSPAPPRPIYAACIAVTLDWPEWFHALGGREFDLTVERTLVSLHFTGSLERITVWKEQPAIGPTFLPAIPVSEPEPVTQVPISKFSQSAQLNKGSFRTKLDAFLPFVPPKTLAQQLLQSEHENEEANEIFAMISNLNACVISPTPTRERFDVPHPPMISPPSRHIRLSTLEEEIFHTQSSFYRNTLADHQDPSPVSSPDSSRPCSPSSIFSSSSQESLTSVSTTSSPISPPTDVLAKPFTAPTNSAPRRDCTPQVVVDTTKSQVQRYLYQGGQSTVLTGGVMLGATTKTTSSPARSPSVPKYRAPVGGRRTLGFNENKPQAGFGSWRRAAAPRARV